MSITPSLAIQPVAYANCSIFTAASANPICPVTTESPLTFQEELDHMAELNYRRASSFEGVGFVARRLLGLEESHDNDNAYVTQFSDNQKVAACAEKMKDLILVLKDFNAGFALWTYVGKIQPFTVKCVSDTQLPEDSSVNIKTRQISIAISCNRKLSALILRLNELFKSPEFRVRLDQLHRESRLNKDTYFVECLVHRERLNEMTYDILSSGVREGTVSKITQREFAKFRDNFAKNYEGSSQETADLEYYRAIRKKQKSTVVTYSNPYEKMVQEARKRV